MFINWVISLIMSYELEYEHFAQKFKYKSKEIDVFKFLGHHYFETNIAK